MGVLEKHTREEFLDTAARVASTEGIGELTVGRVCRELDAPTGSIYRWFTSRAELLASLWLDTVDSFQDAVLPAFRQHDARAVVTDSIAASFGWVAANPERAQVLLLYNQRDFVPGEWPGRLVAQVSRQADGLATALEMFTGLLPTPHPSGLVLRFGLFGIVQSALREEMRRHRPPDPGLRQASTRAALAALSL